MQKEKKAAIGGIDSCQFRFREYIPPVSLFEGGGPGKERLRGMHFQVPPSGKQLYCFI